MTTFYHRIGVSFLPSSLVTFASLIFMITLLTTTNQVVTSQPEPPIESFFHIDRKVAPEPTQDKPEPIPDAKPAPPRLTTQIQTDNKISPVEQISYVKEAVKPDLSAPANTDYIPLYVPQPRYPTRALSRGIEGYAVISFTITTNGSTAEPVLLEEAPGGYGFGRAGLQAATKLKYNPKMEDGVPVEVTDVRYKFSFRVTD